MKIRGPLVTLGAVAALGVGILIANISQENQSAAPATQVAESTTATAAPPALPPSTPTTPPPPPAPPAFPVKGDYVGKIKISSGVITLEITIDGEKAVAYACDGNTVEVWLSGSAKNGVLNLANKGNTSRLEGRHEGNAVVGTLSIDQKSWDFKAAAVQTPAGLYVYQDDGVRSSWIVDANRGVTGVQRQADGSTSPAPTLLTDGTAVIDGRETTVTRVEGDSDVT